MTPSTDLSVRPRPIAAVAADPGPAGDNRAMAKAQRDGTVRPARRPPGWKAPGPPPATPPDRLDLVPAAGEDLCFLAGDWRIFQRLDGHRWSLDDLVTAWMAAAECLERPPARVADLGCGIGAVLLMMAWRFPSSRLLGVEAQPLSVDLARRSVAWNGAAERCEVRCGDFRDAGVLAERGGFDLVTGTPPYLRPGSAPESSRPQWGPCHFEHRGGVESYCAAAARLLAADGRFVACAGGGQADRVAAAAASAGLAVTRRMDVVPRAGKASLFGVYVLCPGFAGSPCTVDPPLVVRDAAGRRTARFRALRADMGMPP